MLSAKKNYFAGLLICGLAYFCTANTMNQSEVQDDLLKEYKKLASVFMKKPNQEGLEQIALFIEKAASTNGLDKMKQLVATKFDRAVDNTMTIQQTLFEWAARYDHSSLIKVLLPYCHTTFDGQRLLANSIIEVLESIKINQDKGTCAVIDKDKFSRAFTTIKWYSNLNNNEIKLPVDVFYYLTDADSLDQFGILIKLFQRCSLRFNQENCEKVVVNYVYSQSDQIDEKKLEKIEKLLQVFFDDLGVDINNCKMIKEYPALTYPLCRGNMRLLKFLLKNGGNLLAESNKIDYCMQATQTPLQPSFVSMIKLLKEFYTKHELIVDTKGKVFNNNDAREVIITSSLYDAYKKNKPEQFKRLFDSYETTGRFGTFYALLKYYGLPCKKLVNKYTNKEMHTKMLESKDNSDVKIFYYYYR